MIESEFSGGPFLPNSFAHNFLVRLPISIKEEASRLAELEGISLNHFISLALAEKLARMNAPRTSAGGAPPLGRPTANRTIPHAGEAKPGNRYTDPSS